MCDGLMPTYSKSVQSLYAIIPIGYLLTIFLPIVKTYDILLSGRSSLVNKIQLSEIGSKEFFFLFSGMEEWGIVAMTFLLISIGSSGMMILRIRKDEAPGRYVKLSWISALLAYYLIDSFRRMLIDEAYTHDIVFDDVAEYSIGLYILLFTIALNLIIPRIKPESNSEEILASVKEKSKNGFKSMYGPTFVIYASIHFTALIFIILSYGYWAGWDKMFDGPTYYIEMIFTFGLNRNVADELPWYITTFSWIFAPTIVVIVGSIFFFIKLSGFAPNGPGPEVTSPEVILLDPVYGYDKWAYFSMDVPNINEHNYLSDNPKLNLFYLVIVFGSIFVGAIIGTLVNFIIFKKDNQARYYHFLRFIIIQGWFIGWVFASMSAPVFVLPSGIFQSLIFERDTNHVVKYKWVLADDADNGFYSPLSIFWFIAIVWTFLTAIFFGMGSFIRYILTGDFLKKTERTDVKGKFVEDEITELPFTKDKITKDQT
jgi:hypothetical protein